MINDGINDVPENTIAVFMKPKSEVGFEDASNFLIKPNKKRGWFTNHFYKCLPLTIANQYGFALTLPYDIQVTWNGGDLIHDLSIKVGDIENGDYKIQATSQFGHGILTITTPFYLRTPPGINLMTINPPNVVLPNMTVMSGVVETDNLRQSFTFNVKMQMPEITSIIRKGTPICGFIPIKRYFADGFELKNAEDLFDKDIVNEENTAEQDHSYLRFLKNKKAVEDQDYRGDSLYMRGLDIYNNKFNDHQRP